MIAHDGATIGELQIRGATMFDEYLNRPDATAASFDGDWFRTGDAAVIDDGGFHRIVGRQSIDIIKTGGFKVGAGEVEAALLTHPGVAEAAVVGVSDPDLGQRIVAFVVCSDVDGATLDQPRRRAAVGAQAAPRSSASSTSCRATRWARCQKDLPALAPLPTRCGLGSSDEVGDEVADAFDRAGQHVAGVQEPRWLAGVADTFGRAGEDQVAGHQRAQRREVLDQDTGRRRSTSTCAMSAASRRPASCGWPDRAGCRTRRA